MSDALSYALGPSPSQSRLDQVMRLPQIKAALEQQSIAQLMPATARA
jgi:hypothetical protein